MNDVKLRTTINSATNKSESFNGFMQMSRILNELINEGHQIEPEAIRGLSLYLTKQANRLRQYYLDVNRKPLPIRYDLPVLTE